MEEKTKPKGPIILKGKLIPAAVRLRDPRVNVQNWERRPWKRTRTKLGRNDACPCGSGRKYKRCCGKGGS